MELFLLVDVNNRITYCGASGSNGSGFEPEALLGQNLFEFLTQTLPEPGQSILRDTFTRFIREPEQTCRTVEVSCSMPAPRNYLVTVFPSSISDNGPMTGISIKDVTTSREIETRRDTFLAVLSHELRDPITALMGFTRLLLDSPSLDVRERYWLENVQTCGQRLTAIAKDMLDVAALKDGNLSLNLEEVSLKEVVCEVLPLVRGTYTGLKCSSSIRHDLPCVIADRNRLAQVLSNLLSNAAKYTTNDGQVTISATHSSPSNRVVVSVTDQGVGIAPEELAHIFAPFHRSIRPETRGIRGAGLGLYIVEGLVKMMGGEVSVQSELGRGSTFQVSLPTKEGLSAIEHD